MPFLDVEPTPWRPIEHDDAVTPPGCAHGPMVLCTKVATVGAESFIVTANPGESLARWPMHPRTRDTVKWVPVQGAQFLWTCRHDSTAPPGVVTCGGIVTTQADAKVPFVFL